MGKKQPSKSRTSPLSLNKFRGYFLVKWVDWKIVYFLLFLTKENYVETYQGISEDKNRPCWFRWTGIDIVIFELKFLVRNPRMSWSIGHWIILNSKTYQFFLLLFFHIPCPVLKYGRLIPLGTLWELEIGTIFPSQGLEGRSEWRPMIGQYTTTKEYNWSRIISRNQYGSFDYFIHTKLLIYFYKCILLEAMKYFIYTYYR